MRNKLDKIEELRLELININQELKEKSYSYEVQMVKDMIEEDFCTKKKYNYLEEKVAEKASSMEMLDILRTNNMQ